MNLRIRHIQIRVNTPNEVYGTDIKFPDGLIILHADNSSGKSTVVQSIIYALGMEGMLGPSHDVPMPHVMTSKIDTADKTLRVTSSHVSLEIENDRGEKAVLNRASAGPRNRHLVTVTDGAALSLPNADYASSDFFVREGGAATRERGLHTWLAKFIDWKLPDVARYDGSLSTLYAECIFPLMVVEQKRGWSGIQARMPLHYKIREVSKRSIEFLMKLDVHDTAADRFRFNQDLAKVRAEWKTIVDSCQALARMADGVVDRLPAEPVSEWPSSLSSNIIVYTDERWRSLQDIVALDAEKLTHIEHTEIPKVKQIITEATQSLREGETELAETEFISSALFQEVQIEENQLANIDLRLESLREDERRNKDVRKLRNMGSTLRLNAAKGLCPACHQKIPDTLLALGDNHLPMTIDQNIQFIESQIQTFKDIRVSTARVFEAKKSRLNALRAHSIQLRSKIRALKETLITEGNSPSIEAVEQRVRLRERIKRYHLIIDEFIDNIERLRKLTLSWSDIQEKLNGLPKDDLTSDDIQKLNKLQELFIRQASEYGVQSLHPQELEISKDTYKPIHQGFELEFDLSASDGIRIIWAYLHGLLELSRIYSTNHLGVLILDEPRQQETRRESFAEFLKRASSASRYAQQVIVTTSEEPNALLSQLDGVIHTYRRFDGKILKKLA